MEGNRYALQRLMQLFLSKKIKVNSPEEQEGVRLAAKVCGQTLT